MSPRQRGDLLLVARSTDKLDALAKTLRTQFSVSVEPISLDLSDPASIQSLAVHTDVDMLVNNAGNIPGGSLEAVDASRWRRGWELKVFGYIDMCRQFYEIMKRRRGGVILNNIGASAEFLDPTYIAGSTGYAGLVAFTRALGSRSLDDAIRVIGVSPGPVATDRIERLMKERGKQSEGPGPFAKFPLGRAATVREIADLSYIWLRHARQTQPASSLPLMADYPHGTPRKHLQQTRQTFSDVRFDNRFPSKRWSPDAVCCG